MRTYWQSCEKRIYEEVSAAVEIVILTQASEKIEGELHSMMADPLLSEQLLSVKGMGISQWQENKRELARLSQLIDTLSR